MVVEVVDPGLELKGLLVCVIVVRGEGKGCVKLLGGLEGTMAVAQ